MRNVFMLLANQQHAMFVKSKMKGVEHALCTVGATSVYNYVCALYVHYTGNSKALRTNQLAKMFDEVSRFVEFTTVNSDDVLLVEHILTKPGYMSTAYDFCSLSDTLESLHNAAIDTIKD